MSADDLLIKELLRLRTSLSRGGFEFVPVSPSTLRILLESLDALDAIQARAFRVIGYGLGVEKEQKP